MLCRELEDNGKPKRARRYRRVKDSMLLTWEDLQYDFLKAIFSNTEAVFTDPFEATQPNKKVSFRDLYVSALLHAKGTRAVQGRMIESPVFADDYVSDHSPKHAREV